MAKTTKREDLDAVRERINFSTPDNYLRIILDSYSLYNHKARLGIADILYREYLKIPVTEDTVNLRRNLVGEIFTKLMQALEDSALLAMMFLDKNPKPFEKFLNNDNRMFNDFFKKARRKLSEQQILRIYGLKPVRQLLKEGLIDASEEEDFKKILDDIVPGEQKRWKGLGKLYTERYKIPNSQKFDYKKSDVISVYHNIKHAFKVLLPTPLFQKIWKYDKENPNIDVIEKYSEFGKLLPRLPKELKEYKDVKVIVLGAIPVSKEALTEFFQRIHVQAQTIKVIAETQLKLMDDKTYTTRELRWTLYKKTHASAPKHYEKCPCKSGLKYKKCHALSKENTDDLFFSEEKYLETSGNVV